ncbi:MAG: stress response translation initiation inhibitor YciH [Bdellovibrionota bacterium]|nr:stress response translation initiation inhibitor YciH [Bdellovibrionota bacterium]
MSDKKLVWSDDQGDLRKSKNSSKGDETIDESIICLEIRRLTSGKGRTVVEIKGLPNNKNWNKKLAKDLKKKLGVGGAFKDNYIEIHGEKIEAVKAYLDSINIKFKQTGG